MSDLLHITERGSEKYEVEREIYAIKKKRNAFDDQQIHRPCDTSRMRIKHTSVLKCAKKHFHEWIIKYMIIKYAV